MTGLTVDCPAKINLFLEILSRRPDGFHEIETVLVTIGLFDTISLRRAARGVETEVAGADLPVDERNLATRSALLFLRTFAPREGVRIRVEKRIPLEAGLGGGSSDAAGVLRGLRELLAPDLPPGELRPLAAELGSDVPFFLSAGAALARGRGEEVTPLPAFPVAWLVLCRPDFGLPTADVYGAVEVPGAQERRRAEAFLEAERIGEHLFNRLEEAAVLVEPRLMEFRRSLPGDGWCMSGSGSAFFRLCRDVREATALAGRINAADGPRALALRTMG